MKNREECMILMQILMILIIARNPHLRKKHQILVKRPKLKLNLNNKTIVVVIVVNLHIGHLILKNKEINMKKRYLKNLINFFFLKCQITLKPNHKTEQTFIQKLI
jgi:hypothetical protein